MPGKTASSTPKKKKNKATGGTSAKAPRQPRQQPHVRVEESPVGMPPDFDADSDFVDASPPTQALAELAKRHQYAARQAALPGRDRRWQHEWVPVSLLRPADYNPRIMPEHEDQALGESLEEFGQLEPLVINTYPGREGIIVGGHQRLRRQIAKSWRESEVVWVYFNQTQEKTANLALNRIHGEWDLERLSGVLEDIREDEDGDLTLTGFTDEELDELQRLGEDTNDDEREAEEDEDFDPTPGRGPTRVQPGDLWAIGPHRLVCGDCTDPGSWALALTGDGGRAALVCTSPPYNLGVSSTRLSLNKNTGNSKYVGDHADDEIAPDAYLSLLSGFLSCALAHADYTFVDLQSLQRNKVTLIEWQYAFRDHWADLLIWNKMTSQPSMDARVLDCQIEEIFVFSGQRRPNRAIGHKTWRGGVPNIYEGPPNRRNEFADVHAAVFPVHLPAFILKTFTRPGQVVVDCFAGTGTTLVAAQEFGRSARLIELEPLYADVILRRAEESLGLSPVLLQRAGQWTDASPKDERVALYG